MDKRIDRQMDLANPKVAYHITSYLNVDTEMQQENCFNVITVWGFSISGRSKYQTGMIFVRLVEFVLFSPVRNLKQKGLNL